MSSTTTPSAAEKPPIAQLQILATMLRDDGEKWFADKADEVVKALEADRDPSLSKKFWREEAVKKNKELQIAYQDIHDAASLIQRLKADQKRRLADPETKKIIIQCIIDSFDGKETRYDGWSSAADAIIAALQQQPKAQERAP